MKRLGVLLVALVGTAGLMGFLVLMGTLIYPGAMKWTAASVCPADKPDTVVVRDTYQTEPGETSTNFTLYCLGPRGEIEDAGFGKPVGLLIVWGIALACIPVVLMWLLGTVRRLLTGKVGGGGGGSSGGGSAADDSLITVPPDDDDNGDDESIGTVAAPIEDYGGQPPLIT